MPVHSRRRPHGRTYARDFCGASGVTTWMIPDMPSAPPALEGGVHWSGKDLGLGLAGVPGGEGF